MDTTFYKYLKNNNINPVHIDIYNDNINYELLTQRQAKNRCINNVNNFIKKYPGILSILPDEIMNSKKVKCFLSKHYDNIYFDKNIFLNVWMEYFYWKLRYNNIESPQR